MDNDDGGFMTLDELKQERTTMLQEYTSRYVSAVFPESEQRDAALSRMSAPELTDRRNKVSAYAAHEAQIKQQVEAASTEQALLAIDITAGFDTLEGGVNLSERQLAAMLKAAGMSREDYDRMVGGR